MMEQTLYYNTLRRKIIATTLSFSLVPLFALGLTIYYQFSLAYSDKVMEDIRTLAVNRRSTIELFFDERISRLRTLAYISSFDELTSPGVLQNVFDVIQTRSESFVDIGVIDQNGDHVAYCGPYTDLKWVNYKDTDWFAAVMLKGVYISDVFMGFRGYPHLIIAVTRREGNHTWILRATIDTDIFESMVRAAQVGQRGDAYIINRENIYQTTPRFGGQLLETAGEPDFSSSVGTRVEEVAMKGQTCLIATTVLLNGKWVLVIEEAPREALMPLITARYIGIFILIGGVILIAMGTIFIARRMTGRLEQVDREKAMLNARLVESSKLAAVGKLAAGVSHEINNPLAVIKEKAGWMRDLLAEEPIQSEQLKEYESSLKRIEHHVERARRVTHRLLGFSRRMEPIRERVSVNKLMDETIDLLENEARHRNIDIQTDYQDTLPEPKTDGGQLQQVLLNLVDNAIDAIGKDGEIQITTRLRSEKNHIAIAIRDSGVGMTKEVANRIFDPFFTTKASGEGTGLGLSISYGIMERLGGRLTVESEPGKGSTFTVHLPINE